MNVAVFFDLTMYQEYKSTIRLALVVIVVVLLISAVFVLSPDIIPQVDAAR